jgi:hypothetical protein|tara:strand:- start:158 stop:403 length:246 start_codon:yes stop_codon:yes gene_type:complete
LVQINQIAIAIKIYSVVQTGAKTQSGGLNVGLFIVEYQGSLFILVEKPPIAEAANVTIIKPNNDVYLFLIIKLNIIYFYHE